MRWIATTACAATTLAFAACSGGTSTPSPTGSSAEALSDAVVAGVRPIKVTQSANPYTLFETLQVRPLAVSQDGRLLFAANTPDNRLEIFRVEGEHLWPLGSVEVGLEPVAVAVHGRDEVWVVNHLSDSVSIVDVGDPTKPRVVDTLLVGDEPRDIVFAGRNRERAFVTTAHRGQNSADDPELFAPGVGRADVWVFDANDLGAAVGGQRLTKITLFADTPRALAATPDGKTVYAAAFFSGNQTTTVAPAEAVLEVYGGTMPGPATITLGGTTIPQPGTGEVVKYKAGPDGTLHWFDPYGANFDAYVNITLPDDDVFAIDATANPPAPSSASPFQHVGTTLFNMAVNPKNGKVYVSNTDAHNDVRFEGHTPGFTSVVGNTVDSRISVIDPATAAVTADNLNTHLDHTTGMGDPSLSLAFTEGIEVTGDGRQLFVIAQGSSKLAVYDTKAIEAGPVALRPQRARCFFRVAAPPAWLSTNRAASAFVLTRFDNGISVVDLRGRRERQHIALFDPEPPIVTAGRRDLYDATHTSALGDQACASCHIGGDFDGLAWDLGVPGNTPLPITTTYGKETDLQAIPEAFIAAHIGAQAAAYEFAAYQPLKGPMTTQSLRGLDNHGAMHWRGDRNGAVQQTGAPFLDANGSPVVTAQPNSGMFDELAAFKSFNVAFPSLLGNAVELSDADMSAFANFTLQITYPPNPIRNLDDSMTAEQQAGNDFFFAKLADGGEAPRDSVHDCNGCHVLDRNGNAGSTTHPGFFGTDGRISFEGENQVFKVPHLRNAYQKLGMYAAATASTRVLASVIPPLNGQPASGGPVAAVRGFGFNHDGTVGTIDEFFDEHRLPAGRRSDHPEQRLAPWGRIPPGFPSSTTRRTRSTRRAASRRKESSFARRSARSSSRSTATCFPSWASR